MKIAGGSFQSSYLLFRFGTIVVPSDDFCYPRVIRFSIILLVSLLLPFRLVLDANVCDVRSLFTGIMHERIFFICIRVYIYARAILVLLACTSSRKFKLQLST